MEDLDGIDSFEWGNRCPRNNVSGIIPIICSAANYISFAAYGDMLKQAVLVPRDNPRAVTAWQTQDEPWSQ